MPKPTRQDFAFLNDAKTEAVLFDLYTAAVRQIPGLIWHFLPQLPKLLGKGSGWTGENEAYFDDKYIPIVPQQGAFLYMQALAKGAKNIVEFGTSYGISTLYLAAAAKKNGGRVITTEHLPHKAEAARRHFAATSPPQGWPTISNCVKATRWKRCKTSPAASISCCSTAGRTWFTPCSNCSNPNSPRVPPSPWTT
ncbi:O-methyltransferase [Neisseria elongata]|uniref:O-methyltransferase n=1 Tax=Neisseria elongata TaxID=495 RepID=UPI003988F838